MFAPMIAADPRPGETLGRLCDNPGLIATPKVDGHHFVLMVHGDGRLTGVGRDGQSRAVPPALAGLFTSYRGGAIVLDGELLPWAGPDTAFHVFDLPLAEIDPWDIHVRPQTPCVQRLDALGRLFARWSAPPLTLVPWATARAAKHAMAGQLEASGGEGLVFKVAAAPYRQGRGRRAAIRWKFVHDVDARVVATGIDGKANMAIAVYDDDGTEVVIAEVTALAGDGPRVRVGDTVTVKYSHADPVSRQLIHPTLPRLRSDGKVVGPGSIHQLHYGNKRAFLALS